MNLTRGENDEMIVTLSERNLRSLLTKLDHPWSHATIEATIDGDVLVVKAQSNAQHYVGRTPGRMHPQTEADIRMCDAANAVLERLALGEDVPPAEYEALQREVLGR